ncbi:MAG: U32 family peptidase [Ruminococcaceae bacterium]|nr:U32 family peptidase [Oscillospiraceae bacterium]
MAGNVELLAPAGDFECLEYALRYGADAVYLGAKAFGMRSSSANFSQQELAAAVALAHGQGKKVYLTLNTLPTNAEMDQMPGAVQSAACAGVDALIVADLGVLEVAKRCAPGLDVHISTQAGIVNWAAATAAHSLGARRVVLARELTLEDIATIRAKTPAALELEVFVHGAMCMSVSGRCLLSNYLNGRDANRGQCSQPCRWKYSLLEEKRPGQQFEISEDDYGSYIMSADDLCAAPFLDQVVQAGAASLKIEGRAKSFYYVASVTAAYRAALDAVRAAGPGGYRLPEFTAAELEKTSHRPYSAGFFFGRQGATQSPTVGGYLRRWQPVAVVEKQAQDGVYCSQRGKFSLGERLEALVPPGRVVAFTPGAIWNADGEAITATPHTKMRFSVPAPAGEMFPPGTILRKPLDTTGAG